MTKTTKNLKLPYPEATDKPAGATQIQALAEGVDTSLVPSAMGATVGGNTAVVSSNVWVALMPTSNFDFQVGGWTYASGAFTCPADGAYMMTARLQANDVPSGAQIALALNWSGSGTATLLMYGRMAAGELTAELNGMALLKAGDKVTPVGQGNGTVGYTPWGAYFYAARVAPGGRVGEASAFAPVEHRPPDTF